MDTRIPSFKTSQMLFFSMIIFTLVLPQEIHGKDTGLKGALSGKPGGRDDPFREEG